MFWGLREWLLLFCLCTVYYLLFLDIPYSDAGNLKTPFIQCGTFIYILMKHLLTAI